MMFVLESPPQGCGHANPQIHGGTAPHCDQNALCPLIQGGLNKLTGSIGTRLHGIALGFQEVLEPRGLGHFDDGQLLIGVPQVTGIHLHGCQRPLNSACHPLPLQGILQHLESPLSAIGHGLNKQFDLGTDCVNTLSNGF